MRARTRPPAVVLSLILALCGSGAVAQTTQARAIDPLESKATFSVQHVFVERVTGSVPIVSGSIVLAPDSVVPVSLSAELDPAKVASGDRDRDASLASADFFDAKAYPVWTFTSTKITPVNATAFGVDGILTLHGVAQPEHLDVTIRGDAAHPRYHAAGRIDRRAFHMSVTRLDPVIGNVADVTLDVALK
jgi:polyisoprenoid-binding protein YceI